MSIIPFNPDPLGINTSSSWLQSSQASNELTTMSTFQSQSGTPERWGGGVATLGEFSDRFQSKLRRTRNAGYDSKGLRYPEDLGVNPEYTNILRISIHDTKGSMSSTGTLNNLSPGQGQVVEGFVSALDTVVANIPLSPEDQQSVLEGAAIATVPVFNMAFSAQNAMTTDTSGSIPPNQQGPYGMLSQYTAPAASPYATGGPQRVRTGIARNTEEFPQSVIYLYAPPEVRVTYGQTYTDQDLQSLNPYMLPLSGSRDAMASYAKYLVFSNVKKLAGVLPGSMQEETIQTYLEQTNRQIVNPLLVNRFQGTSRRTFTFDFVFYPKNPTEMNSCYGIIRELKKYSHPTRSSDDRFLNYPAEFKLEFLNANDLSRNDFFPGIMWCALKTVTVVYGESVTQATLSPNQDVIGRGSPPTKIALTLEFQELEILMRDRFSPANGNC